MKLRQILGCLLLGLMVLPACDDKRDDFSGLSGLVEERNEVRQALSKKNSQEKVLEGKTPSSVSLDMEKKNTGVSPVILYERNVEVVDSATKKSLIKGIAYLNKEGQVVKIKIIRD
jgi:hypothetical protein